MPPSDPAAPSADASSVSSPVLTSSRASVLTVLDRLDDLEELIFIVSAAVHDTRQALGVAIDILEEASTLLAAFRETASDPA